MNTKTTEQSNYQKFRGKCKEMSQALVAGDPSLRLVRGYYHCPVWGKQEHWWTVRQDGSINDPTRLQFPSGGIGEYEEYDGTIECNQCGKKVTEKEMTVHGNYAFCSGPCAMRFVGL